MNERAGPAWDDGKWRGLATLTDPVEGDLCVIGLGGSGLTAIASAVDAGFSVVGIDAGPVAGGAAGRNGGLLLAGSARFYHRVAAQFGRERARALYRLTLHEIDRLLVALPDIARRTGSLRIASSADELADCEQQFAMMRADGLDVERYEGPEGNGLLIPSDAVFNPLARCRAVASECIERGALCFENTPALEISTGAVRTPRASISCKHVLVAVDGCLERLLPELRGRVRTARLQMLGTAPTTEINVSRPVYARWGYEYWQQLDDGRLVLGGFRDTAMEDEWTWSTEPTHAIQHRLETFLREHLGVHAAITHRWAASVGYTESGLPVLDEVRPGVWAIGGYNGTGNVIGGLCARAAIELIASGSSSIAQLLHD
jgi:glycine/D-amino acid oxidase-like deaminating enzyme